MPGGSMVLRSARVCLRRTSIGDRRRRKGFGRFKITELLRSLIVPAKTLGSAMARLFARVFGQYGLILLDPSSADVHRIAAPIFVDALRRSEELDKKLLARGKDSSPRDSPAGQSHASSTYCFA